MQTEAASPKPEAAIEPVARGVGVLISPTTYGMFFIHHADNRIWDGESWRGFGEAEKYTSFRAAFIGRRAAIAALPA